MSNVDGQGLNPGSQFYGHNNDIHIEGNLSPFDNGNNVVNVHREEVNVSSSNDHYLSEMDIGKDLFESDGTEENNEPKSDDEQSSYEDSVKKTLPLKSVDADEIYRQKGRRRLVKETDAVPRVCFVTRMRENDHS